MSKSVKYLISLVAVAALAIFQLSRVSYFFGIKPNFVLSGIIGFSVGEKSWAKRLFFILVGGFLLKFEPGIDIGNLTFIIVSLIAILLIEYLPWQKPISAALAVTLATLAMNFSNFSYYSFIKEAVFNLALVFIIIGLTRYLYGKE